MMDFEVSSYSRELMSKGVIRASGYSKVSDIKSRLFNEMVRGSSQYEAKHFEAVICRNGQRTTMNDDSYLYQHVTQRERTLRSIHVELVLKS